MDQDDSQKGTGCAAFFLPPWQKFACVCEAPGSFAGRFADAA
jgi:hypothetical protein